jgi:LuxR family maltose regulon positive regulatory protein
MQILSTKISTPPVRSRLVPRERLLRILDEGLGRKVILISAPAGYGKSTLLSAWLDHLDIASAWLSLDDNDNDLVRFLSYFTAACQKAGCSLNASFEVPITLNSSVEIDAYLVSLINQLDAMEQPIGLVLDDYHLIQNKQVHQAVSFVIEQCPPSLHLIIATRADPPLPLSKLRAGSDMLELRMSDLRFTTQEAADFLNHTMGLHVSSDDVARITRRTEGWIAGLQMAALSMQNMSDFTDFINAFTGSHHYIFDYLLGEILGKQTPEIQRFLLYTSILEQLSAPLCDALLNNDPSTTDTRPSAEILDELEHSNMFIIPLDHEQIWYRYHPLFADLLHVYLQKSEPDQIAVLHTQASIWFERQGMIADAIHHSFAVGDWERSVRLISANIFALLEQNELSSVARQIEALSGEKSAARPWLLVAHAWLVAYTGQLKNVEPILKQAEGEIDSLKSEEELQTLGGHIAVIRAYTSWISDRRDIAASAAQVALEWLPPSDRLIRCQASTLLGLTLPGYSERAKALEQALNYARECSVSHVTIFAHGCWAWLLAMQGRLREAYAACQEAIRLAKSSRSYAFLPTLSHIYTTMSAVLLEWNDVQGALNYSKEAVDLARRWEQADALHFALDNYGYALFAAGERKEAFDILNQARQVARRTSSWFEQITLAQEIEWYLSLNDLETALQCIQRAKLNIDEPAQLPINSYQSILLPFTFVQIYLAQKQYAKALTFIKLLLIEIENRGIGHYIIRLLLWQAIAYYGLQQEGQAVASLKRALIMAAPEGYLRIFLIEGPKIVPLLNQASKAGITPEYVGKISTLIGLDAEPKQRIPLQTVSLIEPLSGRELEVLRLLAQGCTDKKIAETLVIAPETVHKHLKNIYGKLDVHSRTEAVRRSHELGLL